MTTLEESQSYPGCSRRCPGRPPLPTLRRDRWWVQPVVTVAVLTPFVGYSTWAAFVNKNYYVGAALHRNLISPFYSPCLVESCVPGSHPGTVITWWTLSPGPLILIFPLGFRLTCYYYRKAYYRSFWLAPAGSAVSDAHGSYTGETRFPLLLQNVHRYFFYFGLIFNVILTIDAIEAFRQPGVGYRFFGRDSCSLDQRNPPVAVLAQLPRLPPSVRRRGQAVFGITDSSPTVEDPDPPQCPAHGVRLDEPGLRRPDRCLRAPGGQWNHP